MHLFDGMNNYIYKATLERGKEKERAREGERCKRKKNTQRNTTTQRQTSCYSSKWKATNCSLVEWKLSPRNFMAVWFRAQKSQEVMTCKAPVIPQMAAGSGSGNHINAMRQETRSARPITCHFSTCQAATVGESGSRGVWESGIHGSSLGCRVRDLESEFQGSRLWCQWFRVWESGIQSLEFKDLQAGSQWSRVCDSDSMFWELVI